MTNHFGDIVGHSKAILMIGLNTAVSNPIGFKHFLQAKDRNNAKLIVIDPVFTKSAAKADIYVRIRSGTDIAFVYGMLHLIFKHGWEDQEVIKNQAYGIDAIKKEALKYTPEVVEDITGVPKDLLIQTTRVFATTKPATLAWALGITQHTVGSGNTRILSILQLVLGNMGKKGGGCNIVRGHDNVQGSTDMCCVADNLPGYYGLSEASWKHYAKCWGVSFESLQKRFFAPEWMHKKGFSLSLWYEGVLQESKTHSSAPIKGLWVQGNGVSSLAHNTKMARAIEKLDLMVIAEPFLNEAAILTDRPDGVYVLPVATQFECEGIVVATNRAAQWRSQVVKPLYEAKQDHELMFEMAKKFGFYEEYTKALLCDFDKNGELVQVRQTFQWPEDATREMARSIKVIGLGGWTPERLKAQQENWHMFDYISQEGYGPMKGQYYGLPWPAWTPQHPGTPILYDISTPTKEGGMGFRARFGEEHDGQSLLADKSVTIKGSAIKGGYPEITKANIEKVLGIKLTDHEKAIMGDNWKVDTSGLIQKKCDEKGVCVYGNARARAIVWNFIDQIPKHREPLHSPRPDLVQKYPAIKDQVNNFRVDVRYASEQNKQEWAKEFPIVIASMRLVNLSGAGMLERTSKYLSHITPEMFCHIHPDLALNHGIKDGEMMWVHSPEGTKIKVKAIFSHSVTPDRICMPYSFAGVLQGVDLSHRYPEGTKPYTTGESSNTITNYGFDPVTQIPEFNAGLCRIEKA
ncbi:Formate dehydrogenase-O, major subunit @ selenocysteine-containing [Helicobacter ailurogastricus]|uniref:Formate dehydrogenase-O, major subunit @ selenocysteine-containing n=2 Tax=Helicobacter ailurogastricus TaxID=1578720 RepID=A0A0K2X6R1_9HELI|nr:Formate dehydrogenase-O, major subunit @ selenocysteine-containing [Helicobacter ailurogastricus]CRF42197.1 Formate dehydrogenase-O, major subunit @ selenocysteine-containing [Helicobacter ailurogastricus]CRF43912.1 Formate dehydrogenase-O, major subunit @ selenocysteine-containing [Helicobacter ailurogastricus]